MIIPEKKATRDHTKRHNEQLVFTTIYRHDQISRAEIARATDLTATTVSNVVGELLAEGLVIEEASVPSSKGKPPLLLHVNKDRHRVICLDLTSSAFQGVIVNLRGEISNRISVPANGRTEDAALTLACDLVAALIPAAGNSLLGIGVGAPGVVDPRNGIVHRAVNFRWFDLPLSEHLAGRFKFPTYVVNASHAAALAEYLFGCRKGTPDLVVVKVDHEVGAGIMLGGQLFSGNSFGAGEIGHVQAVEGGEICTCGHTGCLETVCSSRSIIRRARTIARANPHALLYRFVRDPGEIDMDAVLQAFQAGDAELQALVHEVGRYLGMAVAHIVGVLSVPYVLITGSVAAFGEPLLKVINEEVNRRCLAPSVSHTAVELACLGPDTVLLGAAALLVRHNIGVL